MANGTRAIGPGSTARVRTAYLHESDEISIRRLEEFQIKFGVHIVDPNHGDGVESEGRDVGEDLHDIALSDVGRPRNHFPRVHFDDVGGGSGGNPPCC